jgi:hypothetical protein
MSFVEFDTNFVVPDSFNLDILDQLPIHEHRYGQAMELDPKTLYWTEYQPYQLGDGKISFARKLYLEYPDVADYVIDYLQRNFPTFTHFSRDRVNLLKTSGNIRQHMDESFRKCCINIGIKNSSGAVTKSSNTRDHALYESKAQSFQCQDGHAYLLDTSCIHQVIAVNDEPRYLFTYGFATPFEILKSHLKNA